MKRRERIAICHGTQPDVDPVLEAAATLGLTTRLATCQMQVTGDEAPEWIELVPAGLSLEALDGRKFTNPSPDDVVARFNAHPIDLPLDWEHSTEVKAPRGDEAPAAGWLKELKVQNGAIYARIEWTKRGAASVCSKEYRYVSPAFTYNKEREIVAIASAGLTNHPALVMKALSRAESSIGACTQKTNSKIDKLSTHTPVVDPDNSQQGENMDPEIAEALGLKKDADKTACLAAIKSMQAKHDKLAADHEAMMKAKASAETEVATLRAGQPDLKTFVPRQDHDLALARIATLEADKQAERAAQHASAIEMELSAALKAGKIAPATVEVHRAMCSRDGGLEDFRKLVAVQPVIVPDKVQGLEGRPEGTDQIALTASDRQVIMATGVSEEEYRAGAKKLATLRSQRRGDDAG